jgi:hypothetical protein
MSGRPASLIAFCDSGLMDRRRRFRRRLQRTLHEAGQRINVEGLRQVVERAMLCGIRRCQDGVLPTHDNKGQLRARQAH